MVLNFCYIWGFYLYVIARRAAIAMVVLMSIIKIIENRKSRVPKLRKLTDEEISEICKNEYNQNMSEINLTNVGQLKNC